MFGKLNSDAWVSLIYFAAVIVLVSILCRSSDGQCVGNVCSKAAVVQSYSQPVEYAQPVVDYVPIVDQQVYYLVGEHSRDADQTARIVAETIRQMQAEVVTKTTKTETVANFKQVTPQPQAQAAATHCDHCQKYTPEAPAETPAETPTFNLEASSVANACFKCHSGGSPKAGFKLDGELTDKQTLKALQAVTEGRMPPNREITSEERAAVVAELLQSTPD